MTKYALPLFIEVLFLCQIAVPCSAQGSQENVAPVFAEKFPSPSDKYPTGPDSRSQAGVPTGKIFQFEMTNSKIFPDTDRTITVYVPAEYKGDKPACTFFFLDGIAFDAPVVFDNLIAQHAIPVMFAIGISSGFVPAAAKPENPRYDRSFEFDSRSDRLARFLIEEVIPAVENHRTPDGLPIRLSDNPDDRAIAGLSTGGIGSFTVAWERPDAFHRVFTSIGTFVGMRGGEQYYVLVRKTEPKPLRIFMQDGVNDEWPGGPEMGDWWMSNETMSRALEFAGYATNHIWGAGTHNGNQAAAIFPEVMRWLWRDWPAPVTAQEPGNPVLKQILKPGSTWQLVTGHCEAAQTLAADAKGRVYFRVGAAQQLTELKSGHNMQSCGRSGAVDAFALGKDGRRYLARPQGGIEIRTDGEVSQGKVRAVNLMIHDLTVRSNEDIYLTALGHNGKDELWLFPSHGKAKRLDSGLEGSTRIAFSPDGLWLFVAQRQSHFGISYRVGADGSVDAREPFYDFYVPASADDSGAGQIAMDRDGRAYVASRMGVQVFDRNGRVTAILPLPAGEAVEAICFGGRDFDTLYVAGNGKVYARRMNVSGAPPWAPPIRLPPWGAG